MRKFLVVAVMLAVAGCQQQGSGGKRRRGQPADG